MSAQATRLNSSLTSSSGVTQIQRLNAVDKNNDIFSEYAEYCNEDWDGEGALPITPETVAAARRFFRFISGILVRNSDTPNIAPGSDGTIGFEWHSKSGRIRKIFAEIRPDQTLRAYWVTCSGRIERMPPKSLNYSMYHFQSVLQEFAKNGG